MIKALFGFCGALSLVMGVASILGRNEFTGRDAAILYIGVATSYFYMAFEGKRA